MDGWGLNPEKSGNAIALASTPNLTRLASEYPTTAIGTSGYSVGLPEGQMGNSEVGHLTMGAGRIVFQELTRITREIENGEFHKNPVLTGLLDKVKDRGASLHVMGLLSDGGVHSHMEHLYAVIEAGKRRGIEKIFIHAFLDGRDTPPSSGKGYMEELDRYIGKTGAGRVATVSGRYYAMDRDNRWERVKQVWGAMVEGAGLKVFDPVEAVQEAYDRGETDEFVTPTVIVSEGRPVATVNDGDGMIFFNFRADRAREITRAFVSEDFEGFERTTRPALAGFACMTEYDKSLNMPVLFKPQGLLNILGEVLSKKGVKQFRVSETEKYAHVTFFFNGGREEPFPGEQRLLIPSVKDVPTYDKKPEMRAMEIASAAVEKINSGQCSFLLMNLANGDMVGHTGVLEAAISACETVDKAVGMVTDAAVRNGWSVIITADHGNAEQMIDPATGGPFTAHTTNLVPMILVDSEKKGVKLRDGGGLEDIAPTVLKLMGIEKPAEMNGKPLF
jgi:2,3-bisphosphoglycerate-independent phosphoglycerate mutase